MSLDFDDNHCWGPAEQIVSWLVGTIPAKARVLEIGPGEVPFPRANVFVDHEAKEGINVVTCNVLREDLPFKDKEFDFVYCRHLIEDLWNPVRVLDEMSRVGRAGYIETPSPIAELCRGVDGGVGAWKYSGYHHHCQLVWVDNNKLKIVHKYPVIEAAPTRNLEQHLRGGSLYWNSYYLWRDKINYQHLQHPQDFAVFGEYPQILENAIEQSLKSSDEFYKRITQRERKSA